MSLRECDGVTCTRRPSERLYGRAAAEIDSEKDVVSVRNLDKMFAPGSVALIGATSRPGEVGVLVLRNLLRAGFKGEVMLVNPHQESLEVRPVFRDVASLSAAPDLAVIVTPPKTVPPLIAELGARGTRAAVVITAGFGELGPHGHKLQRAALDAAWRYLLRLIGPNCVGITVPGAGLDATFSRLAPPAGDLALVSQSGAIFTAVPDLAAPRQLGFSHVVSLGDMLDYLSSDPATHAILLYIEGLKWARKFMSVARAAARTKPVLVVKAGRFAEAARAAVSCGAARELPGAADDPAAAGARADYWPGRRSLVWPSGHVRPGWHRRRADAGTSLELLPLIDAFARAQMARTRIWRLIQGYRGQPAADIVALSTVLVRPCELAADQQEIVELDINPLLADSAGVIGIDGRIRVAAAAKRGASRLSISPYPKDLAGLSKLRDGTRLRIRPARPEDEPLLIGLTQNMSGEDLRLRFFAAMKTMSHGLAALLSQIDYDRQMALLAEPDDGSAALGEARFGADPDNCRAEFAVAVRSDMKRRGLAQLLMTRLIEVARQRGIGALVGEVLPENLAMLGLASRLGFIRESLAHAAGTVRIVLTLSST